MLNNVNRLATALVVVIVVIVGGVVMLTTNDLTFRQYVETVAIAVGLLSIGYGLDNQSRP